MAYADKLTERMDALADALRAAGVEPGRVAAVLSSAAAATMQALVLDAVLDESHAPARRRVPAGDAAVPLRMAA